MRQGLPLRGDGPSELDGNFNQALKLLSNEDVDLITWTKRKRDKYTFKDIQNEILKGTNQSVLREIVSEIQSSVFAAMMDEATDVSTTEQVVIAFCWVDENLDDHEDFVGLYSTAFLDANSLIAIFNNVLLRFNLSIERCRGQCYDGASVMKGHKISVATQLAQMESRAVYTHCPGHSLNLAYQDSICEVKVLRDALDTVRVIIIRTLLSKHTGSFRL